MSVWTEFDKHFVFFDMSDHIQDFDIEALKLCSVYFKSQLNWTECDRVLRKEDCYGHRIKIVPFLSLADIQRFSKYREKYCNNEVDFDILYITGLMKNPCNYLHTHIQKVEPSGYTHTYIRYHTYRLLRCFGIKGYYRLVGKHNEDIDNEVVFQRLRTEQYASMISKSKIVMVTTLPHAVWPWKVTEAIAMGKPFILDKEPITEIPEPFKVKKNVHFLELYPGIGEIDKDLAADPFSLRSFRVFINDNYTLEKMSQRIEWLRKFLSDNSEIKLLTQNIESYRKDILCNKRVLVDYICEQVLRRIH